jgi:hypothetical protein
MFENNIRNYVFDEKYIILILYSSLNLYDFVFPPNNALNFQRQNDFVR